MLSASSFVLTSIPLVRVMPSLSPGVVRCDSVGIHRKRDTRRTPFHPSSKSRGILLVLTICNLIKERSLESATLKKKWLDRHSQRQEKVTLIAGNQ